MTDIINKITRDNMCNPSSGILNNLNKFCEKKINEECCQKFYQNIFENKNDGIFTCPYGFSCVKKNGKIYNCLLVKEYFNLRKMKAKKDKSQKVFNEEELMNLINYNEKIYDLDKENDYQRDRTNDFLHDLTKANGFISDKIDKINNKQSLDKNIRSNIESIYHLSDFINKRIELYRIISNPELIKTGSFRKRDAYKLWDIYRHIFNEIANRNNLKINMIKYYLNDNVDQTTETLFEAKDSVTILPFLLIDNAVKYSKANSDITIYFYQKQNYLNKIIIKSIPSYTIEEDEELLFKRGYRAKNNSSKSSGSGIGLSIVKEICNQNEINVKVKVKEIENVQSFFVILDFNRKLS